MCCCASMSAAADAEMFDQCRVMRSFTAFSRLRTKLTRCVDMSVDLFHQHWLRVVVVVCRARCIIRLLISGEPLANQLLISESDTVLGGDAIAEHERHFAAWLC